MLYLSVIFGSIVGLSLGLTGGGGSMLAVPLLVYGLSLAPRDAVSVSLISVGSTAIAGVISRLRAKEVDIQIGLIFALGGMTGVSAGTWLGNQISPNLLLGLFSVLLMIVAIKMWPKGNSSENTNSEVKSPSRQKGACQNNGNSEALIPYKCFLTLVIAGLATGILSGMFGVGGGFVIVPMLVWIKGMKMQQAVGTSLLVIAIISMAGVINHLFAGRSIMLATTLPFVLGGVLGMLAGNSMSYRFPQPTLKRIFSIAILLTAILVINNSIQG